VITQDPDALVAPDGSRLYTAVVDGAHTTVTTIDPNTGGTLATTSVDGALEARAASLSGDAVAMMAPRPPGLDEWTPIPRGHSTIVVADPTGAQRLRRYHLKGNFEPEAFSVNDSRLFMIQYLPAEAPAAYRVTTLDLRDGDVYPVFGRFKTPPERMPGIRLRQTFDPTTDQLYTLYTNEPSTYLRASSGSGYGQGTSAYDEGWAHGKHADEVTFVHVLNLREGWAYCAGMPRRLWGQPAKAQAMATSPDGRILYIVDSMRGLVTEMNTRSLEIVRTRRIDLGDGSGRETAVVASPDGNNLFIASARDGSAVYTVDTTSLRVTGRWELQGQVSDLRLSSDGSRLYAALGDRLGVVDAASGSTLASYAADGVESIVNVETPAP
jgi:DNA-binding beta-propeller fold protein YncE